MNFKRFERRGLNVTKDQEQEQLKQQIEQLIRRAELGEISPRFAVVEAVQLAITYSRKVIAA